MTRRSSMAEIIVDMNKVIGDHVAEIALEIQGELVDNPPAGTPVDTGWASVNWWLKQGSPPTGNGGPVGNVASAEAQQRASVAAMASYRIGQPVWISNNTPYIGRLNDGWSQQSPAGFVEAAISTVLDSNKRKKLN